MSKRHKKYDDDDERDDNVKENYQVPYKVFEPYYWWHWVLTILICILIIGLIVGMFNGDAQ